MVRNRYIYRDRTIVRFKKKLATAKLFFVQTTIEGYRS
ncbi:hypothetical protein Cha6605_0882 [Chamaesiphon minutus PCC 6605]|uniref:Uncharacterized protein n=1 Tax=Chamaesiphon minutus (strain ATCC 27169 / PCC 6605) TaxID=1173020 RepID=K9UBX8_CHAP6|nr:hypothetical protein Cha6605_0882 [Chamaesiphon minutus PCC 6605]